MPAMEVLGLGEVQHVAKLANLPLTEKEFMLLNSQLSQVLDYVNQLQRVETKDTPPTFQVSGKTNALREDKVDPQQTLSSDQALVNAKEKIKGLFSTKAIFTEN